MARIIQRHDEWETKLAPRLILGLWHPIFIRPALVHLPRLRRYHIGISPSLARQYFWNVCEGFSISFSMLIGPEGQQFIRDVREAGKEVCVWTVNDLNEMRTAMSWGVKAVLTDKVATFVKLREEVSSARESAADPRLRLTRPNSQSPASQDGTSPGQAGNTTRQHMYAPAFSFVHIFAHAARSLCHRSPLRLSLPCPFPRHWNPKLQLWFQRTQLDLLRTICYQPGPLEMPDLKNIDIEANNVLSPKVTDDGADDVANVSTGGLVDGTSDNPAHRAAEADVDSTDTVAPLDEKPPMSDDEAIDGPVVAPFAAPLIAATA